MTNDTAPFAGQKLSRDDVLRIVAEAHARGERANLRWANLRWANLSSADLRWADLSSADLSSADLSSADLSWANLRWANLSSANLSSADLSSADLRWANLRWANLSSADLRWANLRWADLSSADLSSADLSSTSCMSVTGLPSGHAILAPLPTGWKLTVGCWSGTVQGLRELIAQDDGWPEAKDDQITARRPMLAALADMCDAWTNANAHILTHVQQTWTPEGERRTESEAR